MASFIVHEARPNRLDTNTVWTVDVDANTKEHVANPDALSAARDSRALIKFDGGWADDRIHRTDGENDGLWARLLDNARNVEDPTPVPPPAGGGVTKAEVQEIVTADGALTRAKVAEKRPLVGTVG